MLPHEAQPGDRRSDHRLDLGGAIDPGAPYESSSQDKWAAGEPQTANRYLVIEPETVALLHEHGHQRQRRTTAAPELATEPPCSARATRSQHG